MSIVRSLIAFVFVGLACLTSGLRNRVDRAPSPYEGWQKGKTDLVCMKKWSKGWVGYSEHKYCLVDLNKVVQASKKGVKTKTYKMTFSKSWGPCESEFDTSMKLCSLKGKQDVRVSYSTKVDVAKACMVRDKVFKPDGKTPIPVLTAAVHAIECNRMIDRKPKIMGKFATTSTTTTTASTTSVVTTTVPTAEISAITDVSEKDGTEGSVDEDEVDVSEESSDPEDELDEIIDEVSTTIEDVTEDASEEVNTSEESDEESDEQSDEESDNEESDEASDEEADEQSDEESDNLEFEVDKDEDQEPAQSVDVDHEELVDAVEKENLNQD